MYIYGSFQSQQSETISVLILTGNDRTQTMEIGTEEADIYFTDSPAEITNEVNDTFDHLLKQSATIRLLCGNLVSDFFSTSCRNAVVNIYKGSKCVFAGFMEPQTLSQPYNERWDEIELNCVDVLSALQYSNYKDIGAAGISYDEVKSNAAQRSFYDIATEILNTITASIDIVGGHSVKYLYDGSKAINAQSANKYQIFKQISISELLFLGDEEDDVWAQDTVLEEMLKYLNLHIAQDGFNFYIFSWETVKAATNKIIWHDLTDNTAQTIEQETVSITLDNVSDCDTSISIGDVYNQLLLTANIDEVENVIESPLDEDLLSSYYVNKQKYITEYSSDGDGTTARDAFYKMTHDQKTDYGGGTITDWYLQIKRNTSWMFPKQGDTSTDIVDYFCRDGKNQQNLPNWLGQNAGACILSWGKVTTNTANDDNSPTSKVDMDNYMVFSVNGNGENNIEKAYPNTDSIKKNIPYAVYTGNSSGGVFSPSDEDVTNYIVLSGKVVLNPIMEQHYTYTELHDKPWGIGANPINPLRQIVPSRTNEDGRYYARKYWKAEKPNTEATWAKGDDYGLYPFTDEGPQQYEFKYSAKGDPTDKISKVSVLACMLVIGDKCVVETGTQGQITDFTWQTFKERSECASDDEYYQQCFTIGFDPKIGDKLIGTEFSLQNNIDYTLGIDTEGIAIPIKKTDKVSGAVRFMILGPVNSAWSQEYTLTPFVFYAYSMVIGQTYIPLMAHVSSIMLKEFEVKVYSDNGKISNGDTDNDVIYMSDTGETFVNKKDDLEFKINSALTADECATLGVSNSVNISTPLNVSTEDGVLEIYDRNAEVKAKPEQIYVDSYYNEYHEPRVIMEQNLVDTDNTANIFNHYRHDALGTEFFVQGVGRNLIEGTVNLTLKEINQ